MKMIQTLKNKSKPIISGITASLINIPSSAFAAAGGFDKLKDGINWWVLGLGSLAGITITGCVMWIGYKVLFDGKSLRDMKDVIIGGGLIGGATGFGAWYMS